MRVPRPLVHALAVVGGLGLLAGLVGAVLLASVLRGGLGARDAPGALEARLARTLRGLAVSARTRALENPVPASAEVLADARAHWADHCAVCHAADGSGRTPIGEGLYPRAPDMRAAATQALSDGELYGVIQDGVRHTGMPAWGRAGDDADAGSWALVHLIRRLPSLTPDEVKALEALMPQSRHAAQEAADEDAFLGGDDDAPPPPEKTP